MKNASAADIISAAARHNLVLERVRACCTMIYPMQLSTKFIVSRVTALPVLPGKFEKDFTAFVLFPLGNDKTGHYTVITLERAFKLET